jgi:hypothetical protein
MAEPKIVAAAGATSPLGRGHRGNLIERAMGAAVEEASKEANRSGNPKRSARKKNKSASTLS